MAYREVILLCDVEEMKYQEIADVLSVPIGTVMSRLSRGRKMLRQALASERAFVAGTRKVGRKTMSCTDWQSRLEAYVDAELPPHEMEAFRAHAAQCAACASSALSLDRV